MSIHARKENLTLMGMLWTITRRVAMTIVFHTLNLIGRVIGGGEPGVTAMVVTPAGRIVLVRHSYMPGWRFPGGGVKRSETEEQAVLRELGEEIGLSRWGTVSRSDEPVDLADPECTGPALFIVTGAEYRFRPNLEIEAVCEFLPDALPDNCPRSVRRHVARWRSRTVLES